MFGRVIIYYLLCYVCELTATHGTQLFKKVDCLVGHIVLASFETVSSGQCAFHCIGQRGAGFSYESKTQECNIFKTIFKDQKMCKVSTNTYGNVDECKTVPSLSDHRGSYTVKRPFMGDNSLTRYRCTSFHDGESVESCPVSRCGEAWTPASLSCAEKDVFNSSKPYEGKVTCTVNGFTCQPWDSEEDANYNHNRCLVRNDSRPWCYTTNPEMLWDYCPVEERIICDKPPSLNLPDISITVEWPYFDAMSVARYRCATLVDIEPVTNCPVAQCRSDGSWSSANVSCSDKECYDAINEVYDGGVTCTWTGIPCQRWDSDYPHEHNYFPGRSDLGNRCQMAKDIRPWCFTSDPSVQWEWCPVDKCLNNNKK